METKLKVIAVALMTGVALELLTGLSSCQRQQESALKPIDKAALRTMVDTTAKELIIPGAVVLLRTSAQTAENSPWKQFARHCASKSVAKRPNDGLIPATRIVLRNCCFSVC